SMTAAYRSLRPNQINDATPQQNIIMRVGGSIGTAILIVVLQHHLRSSGSSPSAQAHAYGSPFWGVLPITGVAILPALVLATIERRHNLVVGMHDEGAHEEVPRLAEVE